MSLIISTTLFCLLMVSMLISTARFSPKVNPVNGRHLTYNKVFFFAFAFVVTFVAAFRKEFQDTTVYKGFYSNYSTDYSYAATENLAMDDYGFNLFMIFLKRINPDPQFLVIVTSVITFSIYFYTIGRYAQDLPMSLLLMIALNYIGAMNGIRQVMAGAITLLGLRWIRDRKPIPYILLILLASTIHKSAFILIPLFFVISGKRLNFGMWIFLGLVAGCFVFPGYANSVMSDLLEDTIYQEYLTNEATMGFMRFLVALVPFFIILLYCWVQQYNHVGENRSDPRYLTQRTVDVMINMEVVSFGFSALGLRMVYFARLCLYFNCILPMLLPVLLSGSFRKESAHLMRIMATVLYLAFYAYQIYSYHLSGSWNGFVLNL